MSRVALIVVATAASILPGAALAQMTMKPMTGLATVHVGGTAGDDVGASPSIGGSVAVIEAGGLGAEFDFGYGAGSDSHLGPGSVQSYMLNLTGVWPTGRVRPLFVAGAGAIHARGCSVDCARTIEWTDWGVNGGAGVFFVVNEGLAIRGDVRYLAVLGEHPDPERPRNFGFWRVSVGATFVWAIVP